ncbi:MAG: glycosyltransferase family 2 protein [Saprospiraceae bacterium]|nr:glycosyltransferase family 2 protein [Saprospiraceae bacterium]
MDNQYLLKHARKPPFFGVAPPSDLTLAVVIPAYDEPALEQCLDSLYEADLPEFGSIEILVIINYSELASPELVDRSEKQRIILTELYEKCSESRRRLLVHCEKMPERQAGVGLARKTGMDEVVYRYQMLNLDGLIVNLDADCTVAPNYFKVILDFMSQRPKIWAAGIHFEHPFDKLSDPVLRDAIVGYELHLRYFVAAQREIGLPFAYQTVGSCMVVRSSAYQKMGGMNVRKAGEDFYFLHKFIAINRFAEINDTTVYPSPRPSSRVPFGTGRAVSSVLSGAPQMTYNYKSLQQVSHLISSLDLIYQGSNILQVLNREAPELYAFLLQLKVESKLIEILRETSTYPTFQNRFFQWFNAFRLMKFLHFARTRYPDEPVFTEAKKFQLKLEADLDLSTPGELLQWFRKRCRQHRD